jgi:hypothetical protein
MAIEYDGGYRLAEKILGVLEQAGPLKPKEIARELRRQRLAASSTATVNKILSHYMDGRVTRCRSGEWSVIASPPA